MKLFKLERKNTDPFQLDVILGDNTISMIIAALSEKDARAIAFNKTNCLDWYEDNKVVAREKYKDKNYNVGLVQQNCVETASFLYQ